MIADLQRREPVNRRAGRGVDGRRKPPEIDGDDRADEQPEHQEELALLQQVGLAGLVNQLGDLEHRAVDGQALELPVDQQAEQQAERRDQDAGEEQRVTVESEERSRR